MGYFKNYERRVMHFLEQKLLDVLDVYPHNGCNREKIQLLWIDLYDEPMNYKKFRLVMQLLENKGFVIYGSEENGRTKYVWLTKDKGAKLQEEYRAGLKALEEEQSDFNK